MWKEKGFQGYLKEVMEETWRIDAGSWFQLDEAY